MSARPGRPGWILVVIVIFLALVYAVIWTCLFYDSIPRFLEGGP